MKMEGLAERMSRPVISGWAATASSFSDSSASAGRSKMLADEPSRSNVRTARLPEIWSWKWFMASGTFEPKSGTLAAADAKSGEGALAAGFAKLLEGGEHQSRAGRTNRMAEGDGA